jgi:hypothetical protein
MKFDRISSNSKYTVMKGDPDIRGWSFSFNDRKVGSVSDLILDIPRKKVKFLEVKTQDETRFLLVPTDKVVLDHEQNNAWLPGYEHHVQDYPTYIDRDIPGEYENQLDNYYTGIKHRNQELSSKHEPFNYVGDNSGHREHQVHNRSENWEVASKEHHENGGYQHHQHHESTQEAVPVRRSYLHHPDEHRPDNDEYMNNEHHSDRFDREKWEESPDSFKSKDQQSIFEHIRILEDEKEKRKLEAERDIARIERDIARAKSSLRK